MNVLITGGAGFIGSNLATKLLGRGDAVLSYDSYNDFYDPAVKRAHTEAVRKTDKNGLFTALEADIRDEQALARAFTAFSPDVVVHLAAYAGVRPSIVNPELYYDVNLIGTVRLLEAMKKHDVKRMVFASSSSVYGNNKKVPFSEDDPVDHPISPYAATKKSGELLMHTYHALAGISCACLRFFTVYGPRQRPDLAIAKFIRLIRDGQPIDVYGDGSSCRDYTYIDDTLDGIVRAMDWTETPGRYDVFNLGENHTISLTQMIETIETVLGTKAIRNRLPMQAGDVDQTYADIGKAKSILGYAPTISFEEGVRRYVRWLDAEASV